MKPRKITDADIVALAKEHLETLYAYSPSDNDIKKVTQDFQKKRTSGFFDAPYAIKAKEGIRDNKKTIDALKTAAVAELLALRDSNTISFKPK